MRVSTASLVTCFVGYALARGLEQARNSTVSDVAAGAIGSVPVSNTLAEVDSASTITDPSGVKIVPNDGKDVSRFSRVANITSASSASFVTTSNIVGSPPQIVNFINNLNIATLQRLLANNFGKPFVIPFYDSTTRGLVGYLVGYFTTDGSVTFDTTNRNPYGAVPPTIPKQPGLIQPITVTATGAIAQGIIARGSVSDSDLVSLLGNDYGRPFRIIFPGPGGAPAGVVSGTFTSDGVRFDPDISIPKASVFTVTANGGRSGSIIQAGKATVGDLQALLGSNYGFGSFKIILTDNSGKQIGQVSGSFDSNGNPTFDSNTNIPKPNVFTVTASGARSSSIIQAGKATVGTLQALLGANYGAGPFKIILTDNSGKQIGQVSGSFDSNGNPTFDSNTNIPKAGPITVTASGGRSASIIQAGRITIGDLQGLLGDNYGSGSFVITLTDNSGNKIGQVSGSFDSDGNPSLDSNTSIPKPNPTTVTASGSVSRGIIQAGKASNQVLQNLLGDGYGFGSFLINLTDDAGKQIGQVSGSFDGNGNPTFDSNTNIPKPSPTTVTASGSVSRGIIQAGKVSNQVLQSLLGNGYGFGSFKINLTDDAGKQIGTVSGSFDADGNPVFDSNTNIPAGLTTVTADAGKSNAIIQAGKASVNDLKAILGQNYGKGTFKIMLTDSNGKQIGTVSGSFDANGNPVFDSNTNIPAGLTTVTANAGRSSSIVQAGKASVSDLQALLGPNYGKGTFLINLTDSTGKQIGSISGSFDSNGNPVFNPNSSIPSNVFTVTASGGRSSSIIQNGKATLGDLQALLGDNYGFGKFKILLTDNNGKQIGSISGSFDSNGSPVFDPSTSIPAKPLIVTANPSVSNKIIQAGKATPADLQSLLGDRYGNGSFQITLTDSNGNEIGLISGKFDGDGNPVFDSSTNIPKSAAKPIDVTATAAQSASIVAAGKVTDDLLKQLLGSNYGKSFNIILVDGSGAQIGAVSGGFGADGQVFFNGSSSIPRPTPGGPTTVNADATLSASIIASGGQLTDAQLHQLLGSNYGSPFVIFLVNVDGSYSGYVSGSFDASGKVVFDAGSKIPPKPTSTTAPATSTTIASTATGTDAASNQGSASFTGSIDEIKSQLNSLSYSFILKSVGGKYGPFYITFSTADGSLVGYIKGTITQTSYSYTWSYTSRSF